MTRASRERSAREHPPHDRQVLDLDRSWVRGRAVLEPPCHLFAGFGAAPSLEVGAFTYSHSHITPHVARIGRYCSIADGVQFGHEEHPTDRLSTSSFTYDPGFMRAPDGGARAFRAAPLPDVASRGRITIGNDVWIGFRAYVRQGVTLGDGCIVGAHAVVTRDVPPYAIVAGVPARIVRPRFDTETVARLLSLRWWRFAFTDFGDLDIGDLRSSLAGIERLAEQGAPIYAPEALVLDGDGPAAALRR